jgi:hypothetical protein
MTEAGRPAARWEAELLAEVARQADILHGQAVNAGAVEAAALVQRLASDTRMRRVWAEFAKRRRRGYGRTMLFVHPAKLPPLVDPGDAAVRQAVAAGLFFHFAVWFRLELVSEGSDGRQVLLRARSIPTRLLDKSPMVDADDPLVVERDRGDAEARGYVICLLEKCRELFGGPLYRSVAATASVALDRDVDLDPRAVRQWLEQPRLRGRRSSKPLSPRVVAKGVRRHP